MTSPDPAQVISSIEHRTAVRSSVTVDRERVDTTVTRQGLAGVVTAAELVTALSNAIPFTERYKPTSTRCLWLDIRDDTLIVVATDRFILTKETVPLAKPDGEEDDPYEVRDGIAAISVRDARYLIKLLSGRTDWPPPRVAVTATTSATTSRWADDNNGVDGASGATAPIGDQNAMSYTLTVELVAGPTPPWAVNQPPLRAHPVRVELPAFGPVKTLPYEKYLTTHAPGSAGTVRLAPGLMARFAKVATALPGLEAQAASGMTVAMADDGAPLRVTIGDRFEAVVMPLSTPHNYQGVLKSGAA